MTVPSKVSLKRRWADLPPDTLILEGSTKRQAKNLRFVREKLEKDTNGFKRNGAISNSQKSDRSSPRKLRIDKKRRTFHLNHELPDRVDGQKRRRNDDNLATFQEQRSRSLANTSILPKPHTDSNGSSTPPPPLKRPGKSATLRRPPTLPESVTSEAEQQHIQELANYMHQAALEEVQRESAPNDSAAADRVRQRQRAMTNGSMSSRYDLDLGYDSDDYVYDTYILAPSSSENETTQVGAHLGDLDNVGYLVIGEEDERLWATYGEDDFSDVDGLSERDEEDENAEDYYGADYPEDELDSDDEFDRNAYEYRGRRGSDDEEWDAAWSDDEYDRMMHPFERGGGTKLTNFLRGNGQSDLENPDNHGDLVVENEH